MKPQRLSALHNLNLGVTIGFGEDRALGRAICTSVTFKYLTGILPPLSKIVDLPMIVSL